MGVEQAVVKGKGFRVGGGEQRAQFLLKPGHGHGVAGRQVNPAAKQLQAAGVAQVRQLLAGRDDAHPVGVGNGTLRLRVKDPDSIHFIIPQLNPARQLGVGGEHIQDAAAEAETARRFHLRLAAVAQLHPSLQQGVQRRYAASLAQSRAAGNGGMTPQSQSRRQGKPQCRRCRCHHQRRRFRIRAGLSPRRQRRQCRQALVPGAGVHRQPFKRQYLRLGQQPDGNVVAQVGQNLVVPAAGILQPGGNQQDGALLEAPQGGNIQRLVVGVHSQRCLRLGPTQVPQVPLHPRLRANQRKQSG